MIVYLNGSFVPEEDAHVSIFDRGFLYGDGLFETIRVHDGQPLLWDAHLHRLRRGAQALGIRVPATSDSLLLVARELLERNSLLHAILRVTLSRGPGLRSYSTRGADHPTLVLTVHPAPAWDDTKPPAWRLQTSRLRLPAADPCAGYKTANKLLQVVARTEAEEAGSDEALLLDTHGHLAEATSANLFWTRGASFFTPRLETGALAGITRAGVLDLIRRLGWSCEEVLQGRTALDNATGVLLTLSTQGIVEASHLDGRPLPRDSRVDQLRAAYRTALLHGPSFAPTLESSGTP